VGCGERVERRSCWVTTRWRRWDGVAGHVSARLFARDVLLMQFALTGVNTGVRDIAGKVGSKREPNDRNNVAE
jgi:hypothetical protein